MAQKNDQVFPTFFMSRPDNQLQLLLSLCGMQKVHDVTKADIVVFGGGSDINPFLYGEKRLDQTYVDYNVDMVDIANLKKCGDYQAKVGVCRGSQFLNVMVGNGKLYQHVTNHALAGLHEIKKTTKGTHYAPFAEMIDVTSTHHQMMIPGDGAELLYCGNKALEKHTAETVSNYELSSRESVWDDPEIIHYPDRLTLCYQPHPEYNTPGNKDNKELFIGLLLECCVYDGMHKNVWDKFYKNVI